MTHVEWRLAMARGLAPAYAAHPAVAAVAAGGSVARGTADRFSGVELLVFWAKAPRRDVRRRLAERAGATAIRFLGSRAEDYEAAGVRVDVRHDTVAEVERRLARAADPAEQAPLAAVPRCLALAGARLLTEWQARLAVYPDELAVAVVREHLRFGPHAWLELLAARDDALALAELSSLATHRLVAVLMALNGIHHPGDSKWMDATIAEMRTSPPDLAARLRRVLCGEPAAAVAELRALIEETLDLVDARLPEVDTRAVRARLAQPRPAWDGPLPYAVRAVLVSGERVLLVQHNNQLPENVGKWGLPGGHLEPDDATPEAGLRREMREEFGVGLGALTPLGDWPYKDRIHRVFAAAPAGEITAWDPAEILAVRWLTAAEAEALGRQGRLHTGIELPAIAAWPATR